MVGGVLAKRDVVQMQSAGQRYGAAVGVKSWIRRAEHGLSVGRATGGRPYTVPVGLAINALENPRAPFPPFFPSLLD